MFYGVLLYLFTARINVIKQIRKLAGTFITTCFYTHLRRSKARRKRSMSFTALAFTARFCTPLKPFYGAQCAR
jgi:hypothetical protein